ncbi:L,D-transpeptidase family protein [uncultured Jannaschia sp.]|uniref:L,D-transpeptidase n=1 Tax=uncultured Jannaschia sp. TaxID=293347 RepID=UPI00262FE949|nr:L,D-transpeptidase family protein [uncultured Jannaschia sp.]
MPSVVRKKVAPFWTPTADIRERDLSLPLRVEGGAPNNPLGTRALCLTWSAFLIHGAHDTRKIERRSSSGCIGLYNENIADLHAPVPVGLKVRLI